MQDNKNKFRSSGKHTMLEPLSRRDALKRLGSASAGIFLARSIIRGQTEDIVVA